MEVRRVLGSVSARSHVAEAVAAMEEGSLDEPGRIAVEVRVVVAVSARAVELVDREAALHAREELRHRSVHGREDRGAPRGQDVDGFVAARSSAGFLEVVLELRDPRSEDRKKKWCEARCREAARNDLAGAERHRCGESGRRVEGGWIGGGRTGRGRGGGGTGNSGRGRR